SLRYRKKCNLKTNTSYNSSNNTAMEEKESLRDLGVLMQNNTSFSDQIANVEASGRRLCSWAMRTFLARDKRTMLTLWKQLIQPVIDYCSPLWIPHCYRVRSTYELKQCYPGDMVPCLCMCCPECYFICVFVYICND
ncbi:hypothetical protein NGRA_3370, partial [Nosema granulosis]